MVAKKVFILGLDGATFDIIRPLAAEGRLPAFARMMDEGVWGPLESVANQRSAAAWTSFQTGTNPGKHGIFEFYDFLPETYNLKFINAGIRNGRSLWRILSEKGRRVCVVNVPMTFPAETVNGCLVAGIDCPGAGSRGFTHPESLAGELQRELGDYIIEPGLTGALVGGRIGKAVDLMREEFSQKMRTARHLMISKPWDLFVFVIRSLDSVQHSFWKYMDADHPDHDREGAEAFGGVIADAYEMIDGYLGELLDSLGTDTTLIVMSDHGFGRKHAATAQINEWLASRGYLAFRSSGRKDAGGLLGRLYRIAIGLTSRRMKERIWRLFPRLRDTLQSRLCFADIDWTRTRAYSDSLFANVRINLEGRERNGIVKPGRECRELIDKLASELADLRDGATGEPIVEAVLRREETYHGKHTGKAPDLLIRWREDMVIAGIDLPERASGRERSAPPIPGEDPRIISGDHHLNGIFLARGPDLREGSAISGARIIDLAPTVLHQMGIPIPTDMDGKVLDAAFKPAFLDGNEPSFEDPPADGGSEGDGSYGEHEEAEIRERLRNLGYVE